MTTARLVLVTLVLTLNSCGIARYYRERQDDLSFYKRYIPPTDTNDRAFGSSATELPDTAQLVNGEGHKHTALLTRRKTVANYVTYFIPDDVSPFEAPAHATRVEYLYCMLGDAPTMCGSKIVYESEEVFGRIGERDCEPNCMSPIKDLTKIRRTNHERIVDQLVALHGQQQKGVNDSIVVTEEADGSIHRGSLDKSQKRIWCDFSRGVPKQCNRSIIANFDPFLGRGTILYVDEKMYEYFRWFEKVLKHRHPIRSQIVSNGPFNVSAEEQAWWLDRLSQSSPAAFMPWDQLQTEIQIQAQAAASGKSRARIPRRLTQSEFQREWITSWIRMESSDTALRAYWYGYIEGLLARDFNRKLQMSDEAHTKWSMLSKEVESTVTFVGHGYRDGLEGVIGPRFVISTNRNSKPRECCEGKSKRLKRRQVETERDTRTQP